MIEKEIAQLYSSSNKAHKNPTKQEGFKGYYRLAAKRMDKQIRSKRRQLEKQLEHNKVEKVSDEYGVQLLSTRFHCSSVYSSIWAYAQ